MGIWVSSCIYISKRVPTGYMSRQLFTYTSIRVPTRYMGRQLCPCTYISKCVSTRYVCSS